MWQGNNRKKNSGPQRMADISNSRAMGIIVLIALLFVFQVATFIMHKVRKANIPVLEEHAGREECVEKFCFNPNTITLDSLQMLGFTPRQAQSVLNYRSKGGKFRVKKDFAKLYVVDSARYSSLERYMLLPDSIMPVNGKTVVPAVQGGVTGKSLSGRKEEKKEERKEEKKEERKEEKGVSGSSGKRVADVGKKETDTAIYGRKVERNRYVCNLNTADSAALVRLYGIGGYYAGKILEYRDRLGGSFADKRQLLEIKGFSQERYDGIEHSIVVDKEDMKPFSILAADRKAMERHPYIGKYAARGIVLFLEMKGRDAFENDRQLLEELVAAHIITEDNAARLREYLH